jgi:hypothetical protein
MVGIAEFTLLKLASHLTGIKIIAFIIQSKDAHLYPLVKLDCTKLNTLLLAASAQIKRLLKCSDFLFSAP